MIKKTSYEDFNKSIKFEILNLLSLNKSKREEAIKELLQLNIEIIETYNEWEKPHIEDNIESRIF